MTTDKGPLSKDSTSKAIENISLALASAFAFNISFRL